MALDLSLLRAHPRSHLDRLKEERAFDADTAFHDGIFEIARLGTSSTHAAMASALSGEKAFSLMRPPGHHAEQTRAMGFCYLNHIAIAALEALETGIEKVAVWDFDAHHGNGTEAILEGLAGALYVSVHQHPCYPGTGTISRGNALNFPVSPELRQKSTWKFWRNLGRQSSILSQSLFLYPRGLTPTNWIH